MKRAVLGLLVLAVVAGCGGSGDSADEGLTDSGTDTVTITLPATHDARVYWLREGKVWPAGREVEASDDAPTEILEELFAGPTDQEQADLEFATAIPERKQSAEISRLSIRDGVASFSPPRELPRQGLAQVVYTLTQFPSIDVVEIDDRRYTRADFEDQTPSVLVESPLPFEEVESPLRVTGTANTFEATFNYELTDTDGLIVDENFVTATSGTGQRGTFDFTTDEYEIPFDGIGSLIVFERSAEDGSKIHIVEIPLRMSK